MATADGATSATATMAITGMVISGPGISLPRGLGGQTLTCADEPCRIVVELWRVSDGRMRVAGVSQDAFYELSTAAAGACLGAASGALTGAVRSAGQGLAAIVGGALRGSTAGMSRGAELGRRSGALASEIASKHLGRYHELFIGVPSVYLGGRGPFCLVSAMYTDSLFARAADQWLRYGLGKRPAVFQDREEGRWQVSAREGGTLLELELRREGSPPTPSLDWYEQPLLGQTADGGLASACFHRAWSSPPTSLGGSMTVGAGLSTLLPQGTIGATTSPLRLIAAFGLDRVSAHLGSPAFLPEVG